LINFLNYYFLGFIKIFINMDNFSEMFINNQSYTILEKKMLNLIIVMLLVSVLSMLSLYTLEPFSTNMASLSSQFLITGSEELKFDNIQYCPSC
jgi:hypothetical protein